MIKERDNFFTRYLVGVPARIFAASAGALLLIYITSFLSAVSASNRVIVEDFKWRILSYDDIDIYHYPDASALIERTQDFLADARRRSLYLKTEPSRRTPFFLYAAPNEFEQSTIVHITEGTGGVTEAFKNRFLVGHTGPMRYLNHVIAHEYTHVIQYEILFGGWWKSARLLKFPFYPLWLMEGTAEYSSGDLDIPEREMYVRDAVLNKKRIPIRKLHNFAHLAPNQVTLAYKTSELLIRYIAEKYGEEKLFGLLEEFKKSYDSSKVVKNVLDINLKDLDAAFGKWCEERYADFDGKNRPEGRGIVRRYTRYNERHISPAPLGGGKIAFLSDRRGRGEIWLSDGNAKMEKLLVGLKNNARLDYINPDGRAVSASPDGSEIVFVGEKNKRDYIFVYDLATRKLTSYEPPLDYTALASPSFFPDGKRIVFSAMTECFRDLFVYDVETGSVERLTRDEYDNIDAVVSPDGKHIVYASERPKDAGFWDYDLYLLDLETGHPSRLTDFEWDERTPFFYPDGKTLVFRAEPDTVRNIYLMKLDAPADIFGITDTSGGAFDPVFDGPGGDIVYSLFLDGKMTLRRLTPAEIAVRPLAAAIASRDSGASAPPAAVAETPVPAAPPAEASPYRFRASTDFFFPFIYYSTIDGFFLASYWQISDMLAQHTLQTGLLWSESARRLNYLVQYDFSRYRTRFIFGFSGDNTYYDWANEVFARYDEVFVGASYPFDRFRKFDVIVSAVLNRDTTPDGEETYRDDVLSLAYTRDTVTRKYLEPLAGDYFRLSSSFASDVFGGATLRRNFSAENRAYRHLGNEFVFYNRLWAAYSDGRDYWNYSAGGAGQVRGYSASAAYAPNVAVTNIELRSPIVSDIDYYMWYMFPDFFFKSFFASLFVDAGYGDFGDDVADGNNFISSWGWGLKLYSFILQSYPLVFKLECAKPFSTDSERWYFTLTSYLD